MRNKRNTVHILLFSEKSGQTRRLSLSKLLIGAFILSFVVGTIGVMGATVGLSRYYHQRLTTVAGMSSQESALLGERREHILTELDKLEAEMVQGEKFAETLQTALGLQTGEIKTGQGPIEADDRAVSIKFASLSDKVADKTVGEKGVQRNIGTGAVDGPAGDDDAFLSSLKDRIEALKDRRRDLEDRINELYLLNEGKARYSLSVPDRWPVHGWLTSGFGFRHSPLSGSSRFHAGLDIASPFGSQVNAPSDGVVVFSGWKDGYGQMLVIDHGFGFETVYGHTARLFVKEGDYVKRGEKIALVGMSGRTTGPHLHYEVHVDGVPSNPLNFMSDLLE